MSRENCIWFNTIAWSAIIIFSPLFKQFFALVRVPCMLWVYEYGSKPFSADLHLKFLCSPCSLSSFMSICQEFFFFPFGISIEITLTWIYILRHSKSDILKYEQKDGIREKYSFDVEFKGHMHLINFPCSQTKMFRKKNMIQAMNWTVDSWSICQMA